MTHRVSSLFNLVNVPSGIWVDEEGRILRINEGTYSEALGDKPYYEPLDLADSP